MNNVVKLIIAVALGGGAAYLNASWLQTQKTPPLYVAASADLARGDVISAESLQAIAVPGDAAHNGKALIPYRDRSILFGSKAPRSYRSGDMFFYRDIKLPASSKPGWEVLGPFRIVGVGSAFKKDELRENPVRGGGNNVTIGINPDFDAKARRLFEILSSGRRIAAVQVIPSDQPALTKEALKATENDTLHQTISLSGIENVPTVLFDGDVIRFILPGSAAY